MGPEIRTPPSGSCGASIAEYDSSQVLAKRPPPCRRPRPQNQEDVTHTTLPWNIRPLLDLYVMLFRDCQSDTWSDSNLGYTYIFTIFTRNYFKLLAISRLTLKKH